MRFSKWSCEVGRVLPERAGLLRIAFGLFISAIIVLAIPTPAVSQWRVVTDIRVSGGDESDLVIDPSVTRAVVPGGSFMEITPSITARRWIGRGGLATLGTFATLQRFLNDESRLLYAHTAWGDAFHNFGNDFRGRLSATFDYFDDSQRETVRRLGLGAELGVAFVRSQWNAELWGGARGRRYPNLTMQDNRNRTSVYTETVWSGGTTIRISPVDGVDLRGNGILQFTDSRDPPFDSNSWTVSGSVDTRLMSSLFLTVSAAYQERDFTERSAGENRDKYWQVGTGLRYTVFSGWATSVRWAYSNYTWTDGSDEDAYRLAVELHYTWGRRAAPPPPRVDVDALARESGGSVQKPDPKGNVRLRIRAPGAEEVAVSGNFNDWDPRGALLRRVGDGWWEIYIELGPGIYEYAYVIDGKWTTPPEAKLTVEDGFGGRNGILEVLPAEL